VSVFQCNDCARATVQRWSLEPAVIARPAAPAFIFPSWYTGRQ
jgi:hypothetical protein